MRKGIILAGGTGTRLHPSTISVSKQLMPVYDKPMIYYPLCTLIQAGIREVLVITTPQDQRSFKHLLGDGTQFGMSIEYAQQGKPRGIAEALIIAESFLDGSPSALILGDNLFFGPAFSNSIRFSVGQAEGATIFAYQVSNPEDYGVVTFDENGKAISLIEKPQSPPSNYAVTGLYFYDRHASDFAKSIKPSGRHELEITDLNLIYLNNGNLSVETLDDGTAWLDTGTHKSLHEAAQFVGVLESRQGIRISCPEVEAFKQGWIDKEDLVRLAEPLKKSGYGNYLIKIAGSQSGRPILE